MTTTNLRDEIVVAFRRDATHDDLLAIVLRHKALGVSQRAMYDTLQSIWAELGCNKDEGEENPRCEALEDLMDKVWGFCSQVEAIWDSSLPDSPK